MIIDWVLLLLDSGWSIFINIAAISAGHFDQIGCWTSLIQFLIFSYSNDPRLGSQNIWTCSETKYVGNMMLNIHHFHWLLFIHPESIPLNSTWIDFSFRLISTIVVKGPNDIDLMTSKTSAVFRRIDAALIELVANVFRWHVAADSRIQPSGCS